MSTATLSAQEQENARINAENERLRKQATRKRRIGLGFSYFALILITILMIFPLLIVVLVSFTPNAITQTWPPKLIPSQFTLENYQSLFKRLPIGREMLNTVIFAGAVTIISVFFDSLAAYGLSRVNFKGRGLLLGVLIATMMIPGMALLIRCTSCSPTWASSTATGASSSAYGRRRGIFLLRQSSSPFRRTLDNAARIDGAGEFRIFAQIILAERGAGITTNCSLMDDQFIAFMKENHFTVRLSFDGNKETHDLNRVAKDGVSCYDKIFENIMKIKDSGLNFSVRMTVTENTIPHMFENICYLHEHGLDNIGMIMDVYLKISDDLKIEFEKQVGQILQYYLDEAASGRIF